MRTKDVNFQRLEIPNAYEAISKQIETEIVSGNLVPGQRLPTETHLARQFGVNRHTVREGIRMLEVGGLVHRRAGRRLFVALPHYADLAPTLSRALIMQRVTFRELWEVAMGLEATAAELAAGRISESILDLLRANLSAMDEALKQGASIIELDVQFHALIAQAAMNKALMLAREPISLLFYPALDKLFSHPRTRELAPRRLFEAHRFILQGLEQRDANIARDWMQRHIADFRRGYAYCGLDIDAAVDQPSNGASS